MKEIDADRQEIQALIAAHFDGMKWTATTEPDWHKFAADFLPNALLFPAVRPVQAKTLDQFIERVNGVAMSTLRSFEEHTTGMQILLFGNVAVVLAASEMLENEAKVNHDVSGYLLIKDEGKWRIAAHSWDHATAQRPVPQELR